MIKAYGYLRVSGQGQIDGDGFRRQEDEIRSYCKSSGFELAGVYQEQGVSRQPTKLSAQLSRR